MLQRINNTEDIIDVISGDISKIDEVRYYTHTNPSTYINPESEITEGDVLKCRLCAEDLQTLPSGQLMCEVHLKKDDEEFCDGEYNTIVRKAFNIWLNGTDSGGGGTTPVITTDTIKLGDDVTIKGEDGELHLKANGIYFDGNDNDCNFINTIVNFDDDIYVNGTVYSDNKECLTEIPDEIKKEITTDGLTISSGHDITVTDGSIIVNGEDISIKNYDESVQMGSYSIHYEDGDGHDITTNWKDLLVVPSDVARLETALNGKQDKLVNGTSIKTINNQNILGSGNINITGGSGDINEERLAALESEIFYDKIISEGVETLITNDGTLDGAYIASNGNYTIIASGGFTTYYYEVSQGDVIKVDVSDCGMNGNYSAFALFTELPEWQGDSSAYHKAYTQGVEEWTVTQDGYLCIGAGSAKIANVKVYKTSAGGTVKMSIIGDKTKLVQESIIDALGGGSYWKGKKVGFFGDSITADGYYWKSWKDKTGANCISYGVAGNTIAMPNAAWANIAMENRVENIDSDCDMIVVLGGTNDYGGSAYANFGEFSDGAEEGKYTFYAGLHRMCKKLYTRFPNKPIVILTPLHRWSEYELSSTGTITETTNSKSKTLKDYVNAIKEVAAFYNFKVLDSYAESGLASPIIEGYKDDGGTYHGKYFRDGLHPNADGGARMAKWLYPLLEKVYEEYYK